MGLDKRLCVQGKQIMNNLEQLQVAEMMRDNAAARAAVQEPQMGGVPADMQHGEEYKAFKPSGACLNDLASRKGPHQYGLPTVYPPGCK